MKYYKFGKIKPGNMPINSVKIILKNIFIGNSYKKNIFIENSYKKNIFIGNSYKKIFS